MKLMGACLLVISGAAAGMKHVYEMQQRLRILEEIRKALLFMRSEIQHAATPMPELLAGLERQMDGLVSACLGDVGRGLRQCEEENASLIWNTRVCRPLGQKGLLPADVRWLEQMEALFSVRDRAMQLGSVDLYLEQLALRISEARAKLEQNRNVSYCVGTMGGVLLALVLY